MEKVGEKKNAEFFETWMKSQKEFMENWTKSQKEFMDNWLEAAKKMQESFMNLDASKTATPGKELFNMYNTWFNTMAASSKGFTDEAMKMQETWKASMEKQMGMNKDLFKNFSEFTRQGAAQ